MKWFTLNFDLIWKEQEQGRSWTNWVQRKGGREWFLPTWPQGPWIRGEKYFLPLPEFLGTYNIISSPLPEVFISLLAPPHKRRGNVSGWWDKEGIIGAAWAFLGFSPSPHLPCRENPLLLGKVWRGSGVLPLTWCMCSTQRRKYKKPIWSFVCILHSEIYPYNNNSDTLAFRVKISIGMPYVMPIMCQTLFQMVYIH